MHNNQTMEIILSESALREELLSEIQRMSANQLKQVASQVFGFELNIMNSNQGKQFIANGMNSRSSSKLDLYRNNINVNEKAISLLKGLNEEGYFSPSSFKAKARMLLIKHRLTLTEKELNKTIELVKNSVDSFKLCPLEV